jgi:Excalibur calcium-binding domain
VDGRRRVCVTAARLVMLGLAVVTGWGAVAAAGGTGHARDVQLAGPPSLTATAAPAALTDADIAAADAEADRLDSARGSTRGSRSQDRLDPRFADCDAVRAMGLGPYRQGRDAEYRWYPDADGDGVVCD